MNGNHKFDQIWGFRRNNDSSSDDSQSNSDIRNGQEKLKLVVPNLVSPENDRAMETNDQNVQVEKKTKRARKAPKTENKKNKKEVKSKPKRDLSVSSNIKKGGNSSRKKKSKVISQMTVSDDLRIFTKSIVDDLRVARETMFSKMREEMDQLMNSKPSSRPAKKKRTRSSPVKKPNARKASKPNQKKELAAASKDQDFPKEQHKVKNKKDPSSKIPILIDSIAKNPNLVDSSAKKPILMDSSGKKPILMDSSAKKPIFTNAPDQVVTSSHPSIPFVLSNPRPNDTSLNLERGYYSGISFGHNNAESSSCVGNGYPAGGLNYHQRFDNSNNFGIPNQVVQGYAHDDDLGTRMMNGGGIRYNAGLSGHTMPNHHLGSSGSRSIYPN